MNHGVTFLGNNGSVPYRPNHSMSINDYNSMVDHKECPNGQCGINQPFQTRHPIQPLQSRQPIKYYQSRQPLKSRQSNVKNFRAEVSDLPGDLQDDKPEDDNSILQLDVMSKLLNHIKLIHGQNPDLKDKLTHITYILAFIACLLFVLIILIIIKK
jgi:hypothetical protein